MKCFKKFMKRVIKLMQFLHLIEPIELSDSDSSTDSSIY